MVHVCVCGNALCMRACTKTRNCMPIPNVLSIDETVFVSLLCLCGSTCGDASASLIGIVCLGSESAVCRIA